MVLPLFNPNLPAMMSTSTSRVNDSKSKDVIRQDMNMTTAFQYWNFYHGSQEPLLNACRDLRTDATFKGPVEIYWGGGDMDLVRLDGPGEETHIKDLLRDALVWRDVFGMVPVLLRRRAKRNKHTDVMLVTIPPFGSGKFVMEYDTKKLKVSMTYEVYDVKGAPGMHPGVSGRTSSSSSSSSSRKRRQSSGPRTLDVFVWPGMMPDIVMSNFRSKVQTLLGPHARITQLRANLLVADRGAAHPVVFTQSRPEVSSVERQTEQELLGPVGDPNIMSHAEKRHYSRDTHRAIRQEERTAQANAAARGVVVPVVDPRAQRIISAAESAFPGSVEPLPDGEMMSRPVIPASRSDIIQFEERYAEAICTAMGVPYGLLRGVGSARIKGETDQMMHVFRSAVEHDRADVQLFFQWVHEELHRWKDNEYLALTLLTAEDDAQHEQSPDELQRLQEIRANVRAISQMPNRVRVVFPENPLPKSVNLDILAAAATTGSISLEEQANILRGQLGLSNIDSDHALFQRVRPTDAPIANLQTHTPGTGNAVSVGVIDVAPTPTDSAASAPSTTAAASASAATAAPTSRPRPKAGPKTSLNRSPTPTPKPTATRKRASAGATEKTADPRFRRLEPARTRNAAKQRRNA